jgi:DNA-binding NarL/FixJ family response regulator
VARKRSTAVPPPALTCIDGGRRDHTPEAVAPSTPGPAPGATERLSPAVWALCDALEDRVRGSEERGQAVAAELAALRAKLAQAQRRVDELSFLQGGLEVRVNDLDADHQAAHHTRGRPEPCPLSAREIEVLGRLAEGKVYKQIARELRVSTSTVRSHLHNVYCKLGAVDRAQAVLHASARGWL